MSLSKTLYACTSILAIFLSTTAHADAQSNLTSLLLHGVVSDTTCSVVSGYDQQTVPLGNAVVDNLQRAGSTSRDKPFNIALQRCPPQYAVNITFTGTSADGNADLLAIEKADGAAKNVAVELLDADKKRLPLETAKKSPKTDDRGNVNLLFYAHYISLSANPQPGTANATVNFKISYD